MEIVSNKLSVSPVASPQGSHRPLGRNDTVSSPRKWNSSTQLRPSHRRRESLSLSNNSLLSLKAYYRKLRTFKGTVKALISFRRLPTFASRTGMPDAQTGLAKQVEGDESGDRVAATPKAAKVVVKLTDDEQALQTVQSQVKDLVEKGHVVTEHDGAGTEDVTYRLQGNLEHYTEENLRKRLRLQEHPHMVALTQRLWLSAVHEQEDHLSFGEYEAYMLRLHRLILPEFDLAQSKSLIQDDWTRDTDGSDRLDYRFFHFSMFELVDLWTDTVEAEDYISLLYCIMHSLTFEWNGRHLLKDLDDINPVDILEASKDVSMDEIERDLAREVNGDAAQMYRDRIACEDEEGLLREGEGAQASGDGENTIAGPATYESNAPEPLSGRILTTEAAKAGSDADPRSSRRKTVTRTPSSQSRTSIDRKGSRIGVHQPAGRSSAARAQDAGSRGQSSSIRVDQPVPFLASNANPINVTEERSPRAIGVENTEGCDQTGERLSHVGLNLQGQRQGPVGVARGTNAYVGSRLPYSPAGGLQYSTYTDGETGPISIISLAGAGGDYLNMVARPSYVRKPSAMGVGSASRPLGGSPVGQTVQGQGLMLGQENYSSYQGEYTAMSPSNRVAELASFNGVVAPGRSTFVIPHSPQSPRQSAKDSELRDGSLLVNDDPSRSPPVVDARSGSVSSRVRSAKSRSRPSQQANQSSLQLQTSPSGNADGVGISAPPLSVFPLDGQRLMVDPQSLMVGRRQSPRMSILSRPATSSPSSRPAFIGQTGDLGNFLQTRAYKEVATSPANSPRTASRGSRLHQPRTAQVLVEDLAISTLGVQARTVMPPNPSARLTMSHVGNSDQQVFAGSVVGSGRLSFEAHHQSRSPGSRSSAAKIGYLQGTSQRQDHDARVSADMELSGSPARLSIHKEALSP